MHASVTFRVAVQGQAPSEHTLAHGDLIGRLSRAALQLDDGRVSEAHALVSLRGEGLLLLALRRRLQVAGQWCTEVSLIPGTEITFVDGIVLTVLDTVLPESVLGLRWADGEVPLLHDVATVTATPALSVSWRWQEQAPLRLWRVGDTWRAQALGGEVEQLVVGATYQVAGHAVSVVAISLQEAVQDRTTGLDDPIVVLAYFDTVHIHQRDRLVATLSGQGARLISELVIRGVPLSWRSAAQLLWSDTEDDVALRNRLDAVMRRLRVRLREHGVRADLVSPDGCGLVELRLGPNDRVQDHT